MPRATPCAPPRDRHPPRTSPPRPTAHPTTRDPTHRNGNEAEAFRLLDEGADPSVTNQFGQTALHLLIKSLPCCDSCNAQLWRREMAKVLVEDGLDPLVKDSDGMTARDWAIKKGFPNMVSG